MYKQVCKKSKIEKVAEIKSFQDPSSNIACQTFELEAEASGTSDFFPSNQEVVEENEFVLETVNVTVENAEMESTRDVGAIPSYCEIVDDAHSLKVASVNVIDDATNGNNSAVVINNPAFWCSLSSNQIDYLVQSGPPKFLKILHTHKMLNQKDDKNAFEF